MKLMPPRSPNSTRYRLAGLGAGMLALTLTGAVVGYSGRGASRYLVPQAPVPVFRTQLAAMDAKGVPDTIIEKGRKLAITRCIDAKHYRVIQVRLPDGRDGFVVDGDYRLIGGDGLQTDCGSGAMWERA